MEQTRQRSIIGKVLSTKTKGVAIVEVERRKSHPLYPKTIKRTKKYHAINIIDAKDGQNVKFIETRPISKTIRWKLIEIIDQKMAKISPEEPKLKTSETKKTKVKKVTKKQ